MTALRSFTPDPEVYATYRVRLRADYYDHSAGELEPMTVHAIGVDGARRTALDAVKDEYPDAGFIQAQRITPEFHEDCGYRWDRHDNSVPGRKLPFGCPDEELILWYGEGNR